MKKIVLFATAALALASCSSNDFVGDGNAGGVQNGSGAISFGSGFKAVTRADHVGADAATMLNKKFIVGGFKGNGTAMTEVFDNYIVNWNENTAATSHSNTSDWEYVGVTAAPPSAITGTQTIKYWDYATSQYDFAAYSTGDALVITTDDEPSAGQVKVTEITKAATYAGPTYTITGATADLAKCYISDLVTVYKEDKSPAQPKYQNEVTLTFRNLACKARIALYETIPGYSVKDVKFYTTDGAALTDAISEENATLFTTGGGSNVFYTSGTATVSFPTIGSSNISNSDYNKAHVAISGSTTATTMSFSTLNYGPRHDREAVGNYYLDKTSTTPTYAGLAGNNYYQTVMPNETGAVLELRLNYTLVSTDGSGEEIKVHGAKAFVPAIYAAWKPNYAYTYIFKISDNTNGWTSTVDSDPVGLYPITFDAVVVDSEEHTQSIITTVATPSITTYQKGHDITKDEYDDSNGDIYVQVIANGTLKNDLATKGQLYTLSAAKTEAEVMDALNIQSASDATTITGRNGLVLTEAASDADITTVPGADGNNITVVAGTAAKFSPAAGTYAYVYDTGTDNDDTEYHTAVVLESKPTNWDTTYSTYFTDENCTVAASSTYENGTYYQKYTNLNKVYGVKVIKVQ